MPVDGIIPCGVNKPTTQQTNQANDFVNAKSMQERNLCSQDYGFISLETIRQEAIIGTFSFKGESNYGDEFSLKKTLPSI